MSTTPTIDKSAQAVLGEFIWRYVREPLRDSISPIRAGLLPSALLRQPRQHARGYSAECGASGVCVPCRSACSTICERFTSSRPKGIVRGHASARFESTTLVATRATTTKAALGSTTAKCGLRSQGRPAMLNCITSRSCLACYEQPRSDFGLDYSPSSKMGSDSEARFFRACAARLLAFGGVPRTGPSDGAWLKYAPALRPDEGTRCERPRRGSAPDTSSALPTTPLAPASPPFNGVPPNTAEAVR